MRLLGLTWVLVGFFSIAIVTAQLIGRTQPPDEISPELEPCRDSWCILGNLAANPTSAEILNLCDRYVCGTNHVDVVYVRDSKSGLSLYIQPDKNGIAVNLKVDASQQPSLASWFFEYGMPCRIFTDSASNALLAYDTMALNLGKFDLAEKSRFGFDTPVSSIWVYSQKKHLCSEPVPGWHTVAWRGFMSPDRYLQLMAVDK